MIQLLSSFEGELVNYYDMFFLENIVQEINYIKELISEIDESIWQGRCIDVGCGTGAHALRLSEFFNSILALDISYDMIKYAKKYHKADNIDYVCEDIREFDTIEKGNVAIALSHVIGYQLDNNSVEKMLINVNRALEINGIFMFNFYNEPALFQGKLKPQYKKIQNRYTSISRFSNASIEAEENVLLLDYFYIINTLDDKDLKSIEIHEKIRYFSVKEMEYYLEKAGFKIINFFHYGSQEKLLCVHWNAGVIVRKVRNI